MILYIVDGNSYFYRAFHAIKNLSNSKGFPTNAIYGFSNMLLKIIKDKNPDLMTVVFDSPIPTERHRIYKDYKAQRPKMPESLSVQIPYIKQITKSFGMPIFEIPGYEADDIICYIAKKIQCIDIKIFILSADKDIMQIVSDNIKIYDQMKDLIIDKDYVIKKFGVEPSKIPDIMALSGDTSDNIPGAKGIGNKTAKELIIKFGSLDELFLNLPKIKNKRIKKIITDNLETIKLSRTLAMVNPNIPLEISLNDLKSTEQDLTTLLNLFIEFEFKSLINQLSHKHSKISNKATYSAITDIKDLLRFLANEGLN